MVLNSCKYVYICRIVRYSYFSNYLEIMATSTAMSSRGQIVLPISSRKKLNLGKGSQFLVVTDNENILLKPVKDPSLDEFYSLIEQAQKTAAQLGLTEEDINAEIKTMRAEKRK